MLISSPTRHSAFHSVCCLAAILSLAMTCPSDVVYAQTGSKPFELLILGPDGEPIPEAQVEIRGRPKATPDWVIEGEVLKKGSYGMFVKPTQAGHLKLRLPNKSNYSFSIKADGYGPYWAEWERDELPATFTAELDLGRTVGGVVIDEAGKPVVGAQVRPSVNFKKRPGDTSTLGVGTSIKTDEQGHWTYANLPRDKEFFGIEITHPKFKPHRAKFSAETFESTDGQVPQQTITMSKGLSVTGIVVDATGNPVIGALIRTQLFNDIRSANTNDVGVYELSGCEDGVARIVVSAPGLAVDMQQVHVAENMEAVNFTMQPGGHVRIRVVDEQGKPVPKARIFFQRWREGSYNYFEFDHVDQYADANGIWEWNEAPVDEFKADICRPNGMQLGKQSLMARAEEYVFAPPPALVVVGRVIDAETKQPIENFQVVPGVRSSAEHMNWVPNEIFEAQNGTFEHRETHDYFAHLFKIQARGYKPVESRDIKSNEGRVEVTFELERGAEIEIRVMTPKGLPAVGAKVALGIPGAQINIENGDIDDNSTYAQRTIVNAAGRLRFPGQSTAYQLVIVHESGFAHFKSDQAERMDLVRLTPWASAEGTFRVAKQPLAGVEMVLSSGTVHSYGDDVPNIFTTCKSITNQAGAFRFSRVFPGSGRVQRSILRMVNEGAKEVTSSTSLSAEFVAEQSTQIDFGLAGCPVVGRLVKPTLYTERVLWSFADISVEPQIGPGPIPVPDELKDQPGQANDWYIQWLKTDAGKAWAAASAKAQRTLRTSPRYSATCDTQGNFKIDDMPAGSYFLSVRFYESPRVGQLQNFVFDVPETATDNGTVIDLGAVQLEDAL